MSNGPNNGTLGMEMAEKPAQRSSQWDVGKENLKRDRDGAKWRESSWYSGDYANRGAP